jgi:hypothetical protein
MLSFPFSVAYLDSYNHKKARDLIIKIYLPQIWKPTILGRMYLYLGRY